MEELAMHRGLAIGVVTKSQLVLRDIDALQPLSEHNQLTTHLTVTTTDTELARKLEPRAPRPDLRLEAVRKLNENGVNAAVICAPVLPGITDSAGDLEALVAAAAQAGAKYVYANPLFLKDCAAKMFLPFLEQHFPHLVTAYQNRYGKDAYVSPIYRKRIAEMMNKFAHKYRLPDGEERRRTRAQKPEPAQV